MYQVAEVKQVRNEKYHDFGIEHILNFKSDNYEEVSTQNKDWIIEEPSMITFVNIADYLLKELLYSLLLSLSKLNQHPNWNDSHKQHIRSKENTAY